MHDEEDVGSTQEVMLASLSPNGEMPTIRPGIVHRLDKGTTGKSFAEGKSAAEIRWLHTFIPHGARFQLKAAIQLPAFSFDHRSGARSVNAWNMEVKCRTAVPAGLMVVAKDDFSHAHLCQQFKEHTVSTFPSV